MSNKNSDLAPQVVPSLDVGRHEEFHVADIQFFEQVFPQTIEAEESEDEDS